MISDLHPEKTVENFEEIYPAIKTILSVVFDDSINVHDDLSMSINYRPEHRTEITTDNFEKLFKIKSALVFAAVTCKFDIIRTKNDMFQTYDPISGFSPESTCPAIAALNALASIAPVTLLDKLEHLDKIEMVSELVTMVTIASQKNGETFAENINALAEFLKKYQSKITK